MASESELKREKCEIEGEIEHPKVKYTGNNTKQQPQQSLRWGTELSPSYVTVGLHSFSLKSVSEACKERIGGKYACRCSSAT